MNLKGYIISSLVRWILFFTITVPIILACSVLLLLPGQAGPVWSHKAHLLWCRMIVYLFGVELAVRDPELVVRDQPVIYIANHQSILDIMVIGAALRCQYRWLVKSELFRIPILGWGMRRTGYIPVERGSKNKARQSFYQAADRIRQGNSIVVFPEGTFIDDWQLLPFRSGAFIIAQRAKVCVQYLTISGSHNVFPDQEGRLLPRLRPGKVELTVHPPLKAQDYQDWELDEFRRHAEKAIGSQLKDMSGSN